MVSITKDSTRLKGVPEFNPELCSKVWVPVMDHIVKQAKLSNNTIEKHLCNLLGAQFPALKLHAVKIV